MMVDMSGLKPTGYVPPQDIRWLTEDHAHWFKLTSVIAVMTIRECKDSTTEETRYFISSFDATNPKRLGQIVRAHWGIENNLHWVS
jgi:hypothetical protein